MTVSVQLPSVGDTYTTKTNGYVGTVEEIRENKSGTYSLRLDVDGKTHWTTFSG